MFDRLVDFILSVLDRLNPFVWVRPDELAVWEVGAQYGPAGPGIKVCIPIVRVYRRVLAKRQTIDLQDQPLESADGTSWLVSCSVTYRIVNAVLALIETQDFDDSIEVDAMEIIATWINQAKDENITVLKLIAGCQRKIKGMAGKWGCEAEKMGVNGLVRTGVYYVRGIEAPE